MKASLRSVRIAPKKASLVAKMVRGLSVPEAMDVLHHTNKKAARIFEELLRSAMSNATHNDNQNAQMLVIKSLIVNKAQAYHRGVPMARGRVRPMRKFLSHINITLGIADDAESPANGEKKSTAKAEKVQKDASQKAKTPVKTTARTAGKKETTEKSTSKPSGSSSVSSKSKKDDSTTSTQ